MSAPSVLIVEDDPQLGQIFSLTLKNHFDVQLVSDGDVALQTLQDLTPLLMVLDMHLPGASGADILNYVRAEPRFDQTRVILATADVRRAQELQNEADVVLLKPVSPAQLRDLALRLAPKNA